MKAMKFAVVFVIVAMAATACAPAAPPAPQVVKETVVVKEEVPVEVTKIVEVAGTPQVKTEIVTATPAPVKEPDKIKIMSPCGAETVADWNYDPILQAVEQATNTDIEMVTVDWGAFIDQINAGAASGAVPDIIGVVDPNLRSTLEKWVADGVIAPFEGAVAEAAPNVLAEYADNPLLNELKINGKIYLQPVGWDKGIFPNMGLLHVRKDLLDKYGMQPPDTFDDYFKYLKTCQEQKDGTGVVFSGTGGVGPAINAFVGTYGAPMRGWVKKDGGYEFWAIQPGVKEGLLLFRKMIEQGLVDPASWELSGDDARAKYVSGEACSYIFNGGGHIGRIQNDMLLVNDKFQEWMLPAPDAGAGSRGYTSEEMFWGTSQIGGMKNNNPEAAARVINYLTSDEGYQLTAAGIEGRDYEVVDGQIKLLAQRAKDGFPTEAGDTGFHPLATCIVSWVPMKWQNWQLLYGKDEAFVKWYEQMMANQGQYQVPAYGTIVTSPKWTDFQPTANDLINTAFVEIVQAKSDDAAGKRYDQFVQDWLSSGGTDAQAEMSQLLTDLYAQ